MPRREGIRSWLRGAFGRRSPPLSRWILFGSILRDANPNDVDVIIVSLEWDIRELCHELKSEFLQRFELPLHLQLFHVSQTADIEAFIRRAKFIDEAP